VSQRNISVRIETGLYRLFKSIGRIVHALNTKIWSRLPRQQGPFSALPLPGERNFGTIFLLTRELLARGSHKQNYQ